MDTSLESAGKKYIAAFCLSFLLCWSMIGIFNFCVDPYAIFARPLRIGFNALKPKLHTNEILVKIGSARLYKPDGIIVGMSTVRHGLSPYHPAWKGLRMMNLGIGASTPNQWFMFIQHVNKITTLKSITIGLNFVAFNAYYEPVSRIEDGFDEKDFFINRDGSPNFPFGLIYRSLFSSAATEASIFTIQQSHAAAILHLEKIEQDLSFPSGERVSFTNENDFVRMERNLSDKHLLVKDKGFSFENPDLDMNTISSFRQIVTFARKNNIQLTLMIEPYHARTLRLINSLGLWPKFEEWKREVSKVVYDNNRTNPEQLQYHCYDFATFSDFVNKPIQKDGNQDVGY